MIFNVVVIKLANYRTENFSQKTLFNLCANQNIILCCGLYHFVSHVDLDKLFLNILNLTNSEIQLATFIITEQRIYIEGNLNNSSVLHLFRVNSTLCIIFSLCLQYLTFFITTFSLTTTNKHINVLFRLHYKKKTIL